MSVDYLSALNSKGSGLNITQIVDSLVQAETAPQKELLQNKIDTRNTAISALATLSSELGTLKTSISGFKGTPNMRPPAPAQQYNFRDQHLDRRSFTSDVQVTALGNFTNPRVFRLHLTNPRTRNRFNLGRFRYMERRRQDLHPRHQRISDQRHYFQ